MAGKWKNLQLAGDVKIKVDAEDWDRISEHSWRVIKSSTGREKVITSIRGPNGPRNITLGRFLMNPPKGKQVYPRRFQEGLDYRKDNLMVCTLKERQRTLPKNRKENSSKFRGVSYVKKSKKWRAGIEVSNKSINLGNFESEAEAAEAYNRAAKKFFGEVAYQNSIGRQKTNRK